MDTSTTPSTTTLASTQGAPPPCLDAFDGVDVVSTWRGREGYEDYPKHMIECPLSEEALAMWYGLDLSAHPSFKEQLKGLKQLLKAPPTSLRLPSFMPKHVQASKVTPYQVRGVGVGASGPPWCGGHAMGGGGPNHPTLPPPLCVGEHHLHH